MNMKKVCLVSSAHPVTDTRIFHKQACSLSRAGYQVFVVGRKGVNGEKAPEDIHILPVVNYRSRLQRFLINPIFIFRTLLKVRAKVYHLHDPDLVPLGLILRCLNRRVVYDIHEDYPSQLRDKPYLPRALRPLIAAIFARWEKFACHHFNATITATDHIARRLCHQASATKNHHPHQQCRHHIVTVKNYPSLKNGATVTGANAAPGTTFRLIHLASILTPQRGISLLLQALDALPGCELILAGRFVTPEYETEIRRHPSFSRVTYLNIIPHQETFRWYSSAHAGIIPSLPVLGYEFALPVKMFEFMAAGLPVIAPDFPPIREIIDESNAGVVFQPGDVNSLIQAINYLASHPKQARAMGENGARAAARKYNWEEEEKKLLKIYERLI